MSLKTTAAPCALLLAAAFAVPAQAQSPAASPEVQTLDTVIVTGVRNPEDPPVVADARALLSRTPGSVAVVSAESAVFYVALLVPHAKHKLYYI